MIIVDAFKYEGKTMLYCKSEDIEIQRYSTAIINDRKYNIVKSDKMKSITGMVTIALLIDTVDKIDVRQDISLNF